MESRRWYRKWRVGIRCVIASVVVAVHSGAASATEATVVALPPFIVEEAHKGPPWRYVQIAEFEVLSRCSDATTRAIVQAYFRLHRSLELVLPARLQVKHGVPKALIFYDDELQPVASQEVIAKMMQSHPAPITTDDAPMSFGGRPFRPAVKTQYSFLPNLRLWDTDAMMVFSIVRPGNLDPDTLTLTPEYLAYSLRARIPSLPPWFISGFNTLYRKAKLSGAGIEFEPLEWVGEVIPPPPQGAPAASSPPAPRPVPPPTPILLRGFFAGEIPAAVAGQPSPVPLWRAQAALWVRWGLDRRELAERQAFWTFVERAAVQAVNEELFKGCFGLDYAKVEAQLAMYLPTAVKRRVHISRPRDRDPKIGLRLATDTEDARIKGDRDRPEVPYVRTLSPDLAQKYLEQARRTLRRPYERGERDGRLLASLGLCESEAGNDVEARAFLEAAAAAGPVRPRAGYELARLRFNQLRMDAGGSPRRLSTEEAVSVFSLLFAARAQPSPQPELYELIAAVWLQCEPTPTRKHLAVLDEGVRLFPQRTELIFRAASLYAAHGYSAEVEVLARWGENTASSEKDRARFAKFLKP